jgi:hypothetical protein
MAEPWSAVPEWMTKAEGDCEIPWCITPNNAWRSCSKPIQELLHINLSLPQQSCQGSHLDSLVQRNNATATAGPHHHMAAGLANRRKTQPFQRANDLPSGKVWELRHGQER